MKPIWLKVAETPIREEHYQRAVQRCLKSGRVDSGPAVEQLEAEVAERLGVPREWVLAVQSCTAGMGMCFRFLSGQVSAPAITWPGSYCMGRKVEFYDVEPRKIRGALVLVDLYGAGQVWEDADGTCGDGCYIVVDAAHNFLDSRQAEYLKARKVAAVVYSFGAVKQVSGIRGGIVVSPYVSDLWRAYRHYGVQHGRIPECVEGGNFDMNEFSAELILAQLPGLEKEKMHSQVLITQYQSRLRGLRRAGVRLLEKGSGHLFCIWTKHRDRLRDALRFEGIETSVHYHLPRWLDPFEFPRSRNHANTALTLPLHSRMGIADCDAVCEVVLRELGGLTPNEGQSKPKL